MSTEFLVAALAGSAAVEANKRQPISLPPPPVVPTKETAPTVDKAKRSRRLAEKRRRGRLAAIIGGQLGDVSDKLVERPKLTLG